MTTWEKAQQYEAAWWRTAGFGVVNSYHEELKQQKYAERMGIKLDQWSRIDLQGKSVLDVGGGPASLLLKTGNAGRRKVIDPLDVPDWVVARYKDASIELEKKAAEDMDEQGWDEVWIYNVLQHVRDPSKIIEKLQRAGKVVRVFEFLERPADEGHPHVLTAELLDATFGRTGTVTEMSDPIVGKVYYGAFDYSRPTIELHMVNTGTEFPYAYYIAVMSVLKTQKAAKINLWIVKEPAGRYYDAIKDKVTIRHLDIEVPEFPALRSRKPGFLEAHLVDYYRWKILLENGGVFIDLDSLSLSDYCGFIESKLSDGKEFLASLAVSERIPKPYHNSLFAGKKGSDLVKEMLDECIRRLNSAEGFQWGNSGPDVLNDLCVANPEKVAEAEYGLLGGCLELYQLYKPDGRLPDNIRFVHLWANSSNGFWTGITEDYVEKSDHLYARLVRELLPSGDRHPGSTAIENHVKSRGRHYAPLFKYLQTHQCRNIMETGTYDGQNAEVMIQSAAVRVPEQEIHYYGFDLFDQMTPELIEKEFSFPKPPPPLDEVQAVLNANTRASVTLFQGNTRETLRKAHLPKMDLIYIDCGHSIETIRKEWLYASRLMSEKTVVFFDDFFPELPFVGCKFLSVELDKERYDVQVLPEFDDYPKDWGRLRSQLMVVQLKSPTVQTFTRATSKPVLHVLGLAHTKTTKEYSACAYTQKVLKMCQMMKNLGYEVYHYGAEGSNPDCTEHVDVLSTAVQRETYGDYDWKKEMFKHDPKDLAYTTFNQNAIKAINERKGPQDLLLISMGNYQKPIFEQVGLMGVEMGIGYTGVFTDKRVFESYAWMHYLYGMMYPNNGGCDGQNYDVVIPNYYDPADFQYCEQKDDYYLYMGRLIGRKGIHIAAQCCERIGARLVIAGQGTPEVLKTLGVDPAKVEFVGYADVKKRSELMSHAKAIFVPTLYLEPFGGVNVEAMFCGTPAITTDWGGFTETVQHGKTGYRCRTMDDFVWAAKNVQTLDPEYIRDYAVKNYSLARIGLMYDEYFMKLMDLYKAGWYELHPERTQLDWLRRY